MKLHSTEKKEYDDGPPKCYGLYLYTSPLPSAHHIPDHGAYLRIVLYELEDEENKQECK